MSVCTYQLLYHLTDFHDTLYHWRPLKIHIFILIVSSTIMRDREFVSKLYINYVFEEAS
jgi:hypothetical protein